MGRRSGPPLDGLRCRVRCCGCCGACPEPLDAPSHPLPSPPPFALASAPTSALASASPSAPGRRRRDADGSACAAGIPLLQVNNTELLHQGLPLFLSHPLYWCLFHWSLHANFWGRCRCRKSVHLISNGLRQLKELPTKHGKLIHLNASFLGRMLSNYKGLFFFL